MDALGRLFNVNPLADDVYVDLRNCGGVTFVGYNASGDTWTLTEAKTAAGGTSQVLATITYSHASVTGGAVWVKTTIAANSAVVTTASQDAVVIEVDAIELSDDYGFVKLTSTSTGTVVAITRDLHTQRKPANLAAMV